MVVILWGMDYFDSLLENRFERLYRDAYRNPFFETVNRANPIYDIEGAKSLKIVSSVLSRSVWVDRLAEKPVYRRFLELPALRKMMNDQEFQRIVREKNTREMIFHPLVLRFLKDSEVFEILTSSEFIRSCRSVLPATQVEMIESREGAFSDLNLDLSSLTSRDVEAESTEPAFEPDTRVRLKNGFVFDGVLVHYDDRGLRLKLEEGEFTIKTAEIESVRRIKENQ